MSLSRQRACSLTQDSASIFALGTLNFSSNTRLAEDCTNLDSKHLRASVSLGRTRSLAARQTKKLQPKNFLTFQQVQTSFGILKTVIITVSFKLIIVEV